MTGLGRKHPGAGAASVERGAWRRGLTIMRLLSWASLAVAVTFALRHWPDEIGGDAADYIRSTHDFSGSRFPPGFPLILLPFSSSTGAMRFIGTVFTVGLVILIWCAAIKVAGPRAGVAAGVLVSASPIVTGQAKTISKSWIVGFEASHATVRSGSECPSWTFTRFSGENRDFESDPGPPYGGGSLVALCTSLGVVADDRAALTHFHDTSDNPYGFVIDAATSNSGYGSGAIDWYNHSVNWVPTSGTGLYGTAAMSVRPISVNHQEWSTATVVSRAYTPSVHARAQTLARRWNASDTKGMKLTFRIGEVSYPSNSACDFTSGTNENQPTIQPPMDFDSRSVDNPRILLGRRLPPTPLPPAPPLRCNSLGLVRS